MSNKSFTLMEMVVVVIIIGVLATLAIPAYQSKIEEADAQVCAANLRALQAALDIYAMEHDRMPGSLSELPGEYVNRAYAKVLQQKGAWKIKLAYFIIDWQDRGLAYAAFLRDDVAKGNTILTTCRKASGGTSYGVNIAIGALSADMTSAQYREIDQGTLLIADSNDLTFNGPGGVSRRHRAVKPMGGVGGVSAGQLYGIGVSRGSVDNPVQTKVCSSAGGDCSLCTGSHCP